MRKVATGALTAGILLTMGAVRLADFRASRAEALSSAESRAGNLALILSEYLTEAFAGADASLRQLALHSRRIGGARAPATEWSPSLASALAGVTGVGSISVTDDTGLIRHSTQPAIVGQSRRGEYVVRQALAASGDDLVVGAPFRRVNGAGYVIPIGRRLVRDDGTVEGTVVASFVPEETRGFFKAVDVGQRGAIWVFHTDGFILFREPSTTDPMGDPARDNPVFAAALQGKTSDVLRGPIEPGGREGLSVFHTTNRHDLIVAVSLDRDEVLAQWRRHAIGGGAFFLVLTTTLCMSLAVLFRQMDAKQAAELDLARTQQLEAERIRDTTQKLAAALEREQNARLEAEAANAVKDQFLMTVSHELRTPLTAIAGWARMLLDGGLTEQRTQAALHTIERNAATQTRLIADLLDVASVTSGRLQVNVRSVDLADVVLTAIDTIRPAADAKQITVQASIDSMGRVPVDPERIQQVVWNLVSNAVKFTKHGGRVDVTVDPRGRDVEIAVIDSGVGIAPDFLPHVFERFRQEDAGTTRRYGGLGLGLAIVRHLVELHGGTVIAESQGEGHGATFRVRLPVEPSAPQFSHDERDRLREHHEDHADPHAGLKDISDDFATPERKG